jgi:hypothetical protein
MVVLGASSAWAVPSFGRKYETSCATCHIVYPKLTAFGEAFRRNGYQFPEGTDAEFAKEEPISLGSEGYKKVFPNAIWPGAMPARPPVSAIVEGEVLYFPEAEEGEVKLDFNEAAAEAELFLAGTAGENIGSFWELEVAGHEVELEMGWVWFTNLFASQLKPNLLNLRIGKFVPEFIANGHRQLVRPWLGSKAVGKNLWLLLRTQKGIELNGVVGGRTAYDVGVVEGRGNLPNSAKDLYAHVAYKLSGMRLDGVIPEGEVPPTEKPKPWVDNSLTVDAFAYVGSADIEVEKDKSQEDVSPLSPHSPLLSQDIEVEKDKSQEDGFSMVGGSLNFFYENLNLVGAVAIRQHDQPTAAKESLSALYTFGEATYVVYPWFVPVLRLETFKLEDADKAEIRILPMLRVLIRPNVQAAAVVELEKGEDQFEAEEVEFALSMGF